MPVVSRRTVLTVVGAGAVVALVTPTAAHAIPLPGASKAAARLTGARLWVNPASPAKKQADAWRRSRPADASHLDVIASTPTAVWIGDWNRNVTSEVARIVSQAGTEGAMPVLVAYNIPNRDCGNHSAGGQRSASGYRKWIRDFARGLTGRSAVVVLEPDATSSTKCLSAGQQAERFDLLADAVRVLKDAHAAVYIDAGHAKWLSAQDIAARLTKSGIAQADGFALNVSNFVGTPANIAYGNEVSRRVGGKHYIIDTSRNGSASADGEWCNPAGQSVGRAPTTRTGHPLADAFLWIKQPGESDGACRGGPRAGTFWADYAVELVKRSSMVASR